MIRVVVGDMFKSEAQTLVNTVNTVGVMGKGIALQFKRRFPEMFDDYVARCSAGRVRLGKPYLFKRETPPWIVNFPTKEHWRQVARLDAIVEGLLYLVAHYQHWGIESLAVPPLGCGEGQLEWRVVGPTLYRHLKPIEVPVELYAPFGTPHDELQPDYLEQLSLEPSAHAPASRVPAGWVALVAIVREIESDKYHWPLGRIGFQKLAYFATAAGIPTELHFERSSYGPYAPALKPMLARLVNNGLVTEERLGRMIHVRVGPTFHDAEIAFAGELGAASDAVQQVADLFRRMTTRRAEVAASVHLVARELRDAIGRAPTEAEVKDEVMRWKARRRPPFSDREVAEAIRNLALLGWLEVEATPELVPEDDLLGV
jgi:O-acetyl-ADP-ribose deacetylase (regulator of RNase III)